MKASTSGPVSFYLYEDEVASQLATHGYLIDSPATATAYPDSLIEPLRLIEDSPVKEYEGGVCTRDFDFIAGQHRAWDIPHTIRCCERCYVCPPEEVECLDEEVIFGGILCNHFGHMIMDTASRLWYVISHPECTARIAFVTLPATPTFFNLGDMHYRFLEMLGIPAERVLLIWKPTQFKRVIVPDETMFLEGGGAYRQEALVTYNRLRESVIPSPHKRIYLTRSNYTDLNPIIGEEAFEDFFRSRGYRIISPELLSFEEQVALFAGATHIAGTVGSHTLLLCCAQEGVECVFLNRSSVPVPEHVMVAHMRKARAAYVDAHLDFLPEDHIHGVFLMGDTPCWQQFLKDNPTLAHTGKPLRDNTAKLLPTYIRSWSEQINTDLMYRYVNDEGLPQLAYRMNRYFLHKRVSPQDYGPMVQEKRCQNELAKRSLDASLAREVPQTHCRATIRTTKQAAVMLAGVVRLPLAPSVTDARVMLRTNGTESQVSTIYEIPASFDYAPESQELHWSATVTLADITKEGVLPIDVDCQLSLFVRSDAMTHEVLLTADTFQTCPLKSELIFEGGMPSLVTDTSGVLHITWMPVEEALKGSVGHTLENVSVEDISRDSDSIITLSGALRSNEHDELPALSLAVSTPEGLSELDSHLSVQGSGETAGYTTAIDLSSLAEIGKKHPGADLPLVLCLRWRGQSATVPFGGRHSERALALIKAASRQLDRQLVSFHQDENDELFIRVTPVQTLLKRRPKTTIHAARWTDDGLELAGFVRSPIICMQRFELALTADGGPSPKPSIAIPCEPHWDKGYYAAFSHTIPYDELERFAASSPSHKPRLALGFSCRSGETSLPLDKRLFSLSSWQRTAHALRVDGRTHKGARYAMGLSRKGQLYLTVSIVRAFVSDHAPIAVDRAFDGIIERTEEGIQLLDKLRVSRH